MCSCTKSGFFFFSRNILRNNIKMIGPHKHIRPRLNPESLISTYLIGNVSINISRIPYCTNIDRLA